MERGLHLTVPESSARGAYWLTGDGLPSQRTMQGNKKCTDGFSDSSSIGSVLDDADREVSSLTDRAFRSLCISEDTSFNDSNLALSPDITCQVFGNFHQGTVSHTHRKSGLWSQLPSQGTEHAGWAATVQQLPKYVQGEEKYPKSSPPLTPTQRRLEVPISGLRSSNKPISKVSSLIKSFDRTESQHCDSRPPTSKPPALKNPPKFAPLPESGVNFCFDSAFLTVRRVPAEVSGTHQSSQQPSRKRGERESPKNPEMACPGSSSILPAPENVANPLESKFPSPPPKAAVGEPERSKEWARKGTFLHSENSAFESWSAHQPRLPERKDPAEAAPERRSPEHPGDQPLLRQPRASPCQARAGCGPEENRLAALPASEPRRAREPGAPGFPVEERASGSQPDPQGTSAHPPWRKGKTRKGGKESVQDASEEQKHTDRRGPALYTKHNPPGPFPENDALDDALDPHERYNPPFSISKLLTPIIPTKHVVDASDSRPAQLTPSPPAQLNGYQEKEPRECSPRESYKSKAPSLLFNLKDVRRRVKSTYSPSPLLKGLDEKPRGKQEPVSNGMGLPNGLEESPPGELSKERAADTPLSQLNTQQDPKSDNSADNPVTLSSPPAVAQGPFCVNGETADKNSYDNTPANGDSHLGTARPGWCPDSRARCPRKHLSLKLCSREPEAGGPVEQLRTPSLENRFSRSISQETEPEREAGGQNPNFSQKFSPGPLSPEEEDVFYSDSQSDFTPGLQSKAKFSTSSSDQSFASFEDQQKGWFAESQQEDTRNDVRAGDSRRDAKEEAVGKDEPQHCAFGDGHTGVGAHGERGALPGGGAGASGGRPRKASRDEADFRGALTGGSKEVALAHAKEPTSSPSSTSNKHILFAIKDNTLRATPVIKPIMLPLLRTLSSEDALAGGHKEEELPRQGWGEGAGPHAPQSQDVPSPLTPTGKQGTHLKCAAHKGTEDHGWVPSVAGTGTEGNVSSPTLIGEGKGLWPPPEASRKVLVNDGRSGSLDQRKPGSPRRIPVIAFPESDLEDQPPSQQLRASWEEETQDFKSPFLATPRAGPPARRLAPGETAASPNTSSLGEGSACSPAASSVWDDASQAPSEPGPMPGEPLHASPWASPGPARVTRREDLTHAFTWEASSDPQLEPSVDRRTLSPRGSLLGVATSSVSFPEKPETPAHLERAATKPPAVPPKTEKALRRAKKLASKRRKTDRLQEVHGEAREDKPYLEDSEHRPLSPQERPRPRFPPVRSLPPPVHRHSVSTFSEPVRRPPGGPQSLMPWPPYRATQKVLQDPQSGEYFVFDLPLQVKIKTFYDLETGKYVKVSIPSSEGGSPEPPLPDVLAAPYTLYPGLRPLPATTLMPLRCSSQLSAPTFLRQGPGTTKAAGPGPQSTQDADLQLAPGPHGDSTQHTADQHSEGPPQSPGEEGRGIISTSNLEDFATEGIS